jgi:hypothetical protein
MRNFLTHYLNNNCKLTATQNKQASDVFVINHFHNIYFTTDLLSRCFCSFRFQTKVDILNNETKLRYQPNDQM